MNQAELILCNLSEIRRRSTILWSSLPDELINWKPDSHAMSAIQMVRHVLEADYGWNMIIKGESMENYRTPWENRPLTNVQEELEFSTPYRKQFLQTIQNFSESELKSTEIIHPGNGQKKVLGPYLMRIGYHEAVHAGQFISYLREMNIPRPMIWD